MKKIVTLIVFAFFSSICVAQSTQNGIIKEYNDTKKKTPLGGVELVVNNAGSNVTGKDGKFTLSFRTLKPGDKVEVRRIEKAGYEIFNKDALDAWRISNDGSTFTIVLCKSSKFKALKDQYNSVASKSYALQQKKDEERLALLLHDGKIKQAEYDKKLRDLKDYYDEQLENLDNYIDHFARIDLETLSKKEQHIIEMVKEGKIEDAIKAYEDMHLEEKYVQAVENINVVSSAIVQLEAKKVENVVARNEAYLAVKRMNDVRRLQGGKENYMKIRESLKRIVDSDYTQLSPIYEYAEFLGKQSDVKEASKYYDIILLNETDIENRAVALQRYSLLCMFEDPEKSLRMSLDAKNIIDSLINIGQNIEKSKRRLIHIYNSLANVYNHKNNANLAEYYYQQSLKLLKEQGLNDLKDRIDYNIIAYNLGFLYISNSKYKEAIDCLKDVYESQTTILNESHTPENKNIMFDCAIQLGTAYGKIGNMTNCKMFFDNAIDLYRELKEENPQAFKDKGAILFNNIGAIYMSRSYYSDAEKAFSIALKCAEEGLAESNTFHNIVYVIVIRGSFGASISKISEKHREGYSLINQSIEEITPYYSKFPDIIKPFYIVLLQQKANALVECQEYDIAMRTIEEACEIAPNDADNWDIKGYIHTKRDEWEEAKKCWYKTKEIEPEFLTQCSSDLFNALFAKGIINE